MLKLTMSNPYDLFSEGIVNTYTEYDLGKFFVDLAW